MPEKFFYRPFIRRLVDLFAYPFTWTGASLLKYFRNAEGEKMPLTRRMLHRKGVFPVTDRYDQPIFRSVQLSKALTEKRNLPGINWNDNEQLALLEKFIFNNEIKQLGFDFNNGVFESGDAEYLYNIIRYCKPSLLIEAGGGYSTIIADLAIKKNKLDDPAYSCRHICIDPYPNEGLRSSDCEYVREKLESLSVELFRQLGENDILFIDTSHMIRPQGDVLFIYLELLPVLAPGVWVHIHDIFSPHDYPASWMFEKNRFWNEQYLLEAFLSGNKEYRVTGALNYLKHNFSHQLNQKSPVLATQPEREPGSFWIRKN